MTQDPLPDRIGNYRVLGRLGAGGMGEVLLAEDTRLQRRVAIKRPHANVQTQDESTHRLLTEARAVARLDHPNICGIYEVGEDAQGLFIVMPVVEGDTLSGVLARGPMPLEDAVTIAAQVAEALAAAHAAGILHRDIKPGNIIVGARGQARVMDFGLAKFETPGDAASLMATASFATAAGTTLGTVAYMSPEQARGERIDARSDLFSLGVILYESIAGRHPFAAPSVAETLAAVQTSDPPPLARYRPDTPDTLQRIVSKLLRRRPEERYQSAADLAVDLRNAAQALRAPSTAQVTRVSEPVAAPPPSKTRVVLAAALAALVVGAIAAGVMWRRPASPATTSTAAGPGLDSLAVLPFLDRSDTPASADSDYVADGITDSVIRNLAGLPNLKVISRNTAFHFKGQNADARKIASRLGVAAVMTGTVRRVEQQLVLDIELSSVADDRVLFSRRYQQDSSHILKFESDIASDVATQLRVILSGDDRRRMKKDATSSAEAYQFFLRGRFYQNQLTPAALHQAIDQYKRAVAADPSYALAYAEMAGTYLLLGIYFESPKDVMTSAREYAGRALTLDPESRDPHIVLGMVKLLFDWDYPAAAKEILAAGHLQSESLGILGCTAHLLETAGQLTDAEHEIRVALASDPMSIGLNTELGCGAYYRRRYDEAILGYNDALKLEPRNDVAYWGLGRVYGQREQYAEALSALARSERINGVASPIILSETGYVYGRLGKLAEARKVIAEMTSSSYPGWVDPYLVAVVYAGMNDPEETFKWLNKAREVRSSFLPSLPEDPKWDRLKADPRFSTLAKQVGFL